MPCCEALLAVIDLVLLLACVPAEIGGTHALEFVVQIVAYSPIFTRIGSAVVVCVVQFASFPSESRRARAHRCVEEDQTVAVVKTGLFCARRELCSTYLSCTVGPAEAMPAFASV